MAVIHMETEQVRAMAQQLSQMAENTRQQCQWVVGTVQNVNWLGYSRDEFISEIERIRANVDRLAESGVALAGLVQREVDEWEQAAATLDGGAGAGVGAGDSNTGDEPAETPERQPFVQGEGDQHPVDPSDVDQGQLGDCYLMASLAAIAGQNPDLLQRLIKDNGDGTYTVTFYKKKKILGLFDNGYEKVEITVTADFPEQNGVPQYAGLGDTVDGKQEIWGAVIEKAYAEWKGGYADIEGGWPHDALEALTGVDSKDYNPGRMSMDDLSSQFESGSAITVASHHDLEILGIDIPDTTDSSDLYKNDVLVTDHAYYVSSVDAEAGTVTIRNPWGWEQPEIVLTYEQFQAAFQKVTVNELG